MSKFRKMAVLAGFLGILGTLNFMTSFADDQAKDAKEGIVSDESDNEIVTVKKPLLQCDLSTQEAANFGYMFRPSTKDRKYNEFRLTLNLVERSLGEAKSEGYKVSVRALDDKGNVVTDAEYRRDLARVVVIQLNDAVSVSYSPSDDSTNTQGFSILKGENEKVGHMTWFKNVRDPRTGKHLYVYENPTPIACETKGRITNSEKVDLTGMTNENLMNTIDLYISGPVDYAFEYRDAQFVDVKRQAKAQASLYLERKYAKPHTNCENFGFYTIRESRDATGQLLGYRFASHCRNLDEKKTEGRFEKTYARGVMVYVTSDSKVLESSFADGTSRAFGDLLDSRYIPQPKTQPVQPQTP